MGSDVVLRFEQPAYLEQVPQDEPFLRRELHAPISPRSDPAVKSATLSPPRTMPRAPRAGPLRMALRRGRESVLGPSEARSAGGGVGARRESLHGVPYARLAGRPWASPARATLPPHR